MLTAGVAGVVLAVVLLVSGVAKSLDASGTRTAAAALGLPRPLVGPVALLLPIAEVVTAALLLAAPVLGLLLAGALLVAFTVAVARVLLQGRSPSCACFGRLGGAEVSGRTLARNGALLAAVALGLLLGPARPGPGGLLLGTALAGLLLLLELRRPAQALAGDLPELTALDGTTRSSLLARDRPVLVVALSPGCGSCLTLPASLQRWRAGDEDAVTVLVIGSGPEPEVRALTAPLHEVPVVLDPDLALTGPLGLHATPGAVLLDRRGTTTGPPRFGPGGVAQLWEQALAEAGRSRHDAATLDVDFVPSPAGKVTALPQEDGGTHLVDEVTGARLQLDPVGALVWSLLDGSGSIAELAQELAEAFGAPPATVQQDVLALVRRLGAFGVLRGVRPSPAEAAEPALPAGAVLP